MESLGIKETFTPYLAAVGIAVGVLFTPPRHLFYGQYAQCVSDRYDHGAGAAGGKLPHRIDRDPVFSHAVRYDMAQVSV